MPKASARPMLLPNEPMMTPARAPPMLVMVCTTLTPAEIEPESMPGSLYTTVVPTGTKAKAP